MHTGNRYRIVQETDANGATVWTKPHAQAHAKPADTRTKYTVCNGDGFNRRFEAGDIARLVKDTKPDVLAITEISMNIANMWDAHAVRETLFAMGFVRIVWHPSSINPHNHGIMLATKFIPDRDIEVGIDAAEFDQEGRVLTLRCKDHTVIFPYIRPLHKDGRKHAVRTQSTLGQKARRPLSKRIEDSSNAHRRRSQRGADRSRLHNMVHT